MTSAFQEVTNLNPDIEYDIIWRFDFVKGSLLEKLEISKSPHHTGNCEIMWSLNWMGMMLCPARHRHSHPRLQGGIVRSYVHYGWTLGNCKITIESWWKWKDIFSRNADASNCQHFARKHLKASHLKKPVNLVLLSVLHVVILPCATSFKWKDEDPGDQQSGKVSMFSPFPVGPFRRCFQSDFGHKFSRQAAHLKFSRSAVRQDARGRSHAGWPIDGRPG